MREILFRGKRLDNDLWEEGSLIFPLAHRQTDDPSIGDFWSMVRVDPATVGQYTGLTDKNGVKIFEGDIVRITLPLPSQDPIVGLSSVDFGNGCFVVTWGGSRATFDSFVGSTTFEVIGNIHDNSELLEAEK